MRNKLFLLFVFGSFNFTVVLAQKNPKIDSVLTILGKEKDDTNKVNTLIILSNQFVQDKNIPEAKKYAGEAITLAEKLKFEKGINAGQVNLGNVFNRQGANYYYQNNYIEALKNYLIALEIFEKNGAKKETAKVHRNIGLLYWRQGNYTEALKNHSLSLGILKEIGDKAAIAAAYNDIGNVYENQDNASEALQNYSTSLKIYEELGDKESMINRLFNIGFLYDNRGNYVDALKNFNTALKICKEIESKEGVIACNTNIADTYYHEALSVPGSKQREELLNQALREYEKSLDGYKELGDEQGIAICYTNIGAVLIELKNFVKAKQALNDGLSLFQKMAAIEGPDETYQSIAAYIRDNYQLQAKLDSLTGSWKEALRHYQLYIAYRDSLVNEESTQKTRKTQMEFDFVKKEDSLKYQQALTIEKLERQTLLALHQKRQKIYWIAGLVIFIIFSLFIYRNYRTRQRLKLQILRNKIASDLHDDVGSTLTSISIFSQMAQQQSKETIPLLETIGESSRKMLDAMADIVWTINPKNDQFEKIILRMRSFAYELLGAKQIDFRFVADNNIHNIKLSMDERRNLYLIFKEATNNIAKYAEASKVMFNIKFEKDTMVMVIADNGKGFDSNKQSEGNGLGNMKKRADQMGAVLLINSVPGNGTTIRLEKAV